MEPSWRRWYVLVLLTVVYASNIADRFVISTLIEPIRIEFHLSDSSVGFLTGTALAIFYTGMGLPLGMIADRVNRRKLLSISIAIWSAMTAACGLAGNYLQLLMARIGVGTGEAGGTPASQSIIADLFPFSERTIANSIFSLGAAAGSMLGAMAGGLIADAFGWRWSFIALGVPGILLALIVRFTIREPRRQERGSRETTERAPSFLTTVKFIGKQRSLLHMLAGQVTVTFWGWGLLWWTPAFMARSHGFTTGDAGKLLGLINGVCGAVGILVGGVVIQRLGRKDPRWQCWIVAAVTLVGTFLSIGVYATGSRTVATALLWLFVPAAYINLAPSFSLAQSLVPPRMRALCCAIMIFGSNIANLAIAPQLIGLVSDVLIRFTGAAQESLRYALVIASFSGFWAAYHYWASARNLVHDLRHADGAWSEVGVLIPASPRLAQSTGG
jgi:predicted MFS family arabinose efflux permease